MNRTAKRSTYTFFIYGSVVYQMLYSYFLFIADKEALDDLTNGNAELASLIFCIVLGVCDMLESLSIVNPAEEVYTRIMPKQGGARSLNLQLEEPAILEVSDEDIELTGYEWFTKKVCIPYPLKFITLSNTTIGFLLTGITNALFFGQTITNPYARFSVGVTPLVFESIYLIMLLWEDIKEGHDFIFGKILSRKSSVLIDMARSPLITLELLLTNSLYALLASILFSYGSIKSKDAFLPEYQNERLLNLAITGITSFSISYITLFSRYVSSHISYFNESVENTNFNSNELHYKKAWVFNALLRFARSAGLSYFVNKYITSLIDNRPIALTSSAVIGTFLTAHGTYVSYLRCLNLAKIEALQAHQSESDHSKQNTDPRFLTLSSVNLLSKVAYALAIYASFKEISEGIGLDLSKTDCIMLTLCFGIPAAIIDFDYYRTKMVETLTYYIDKTREEVKTHQFGLVGSFFRSIKEYESLPTKQSDSPVDESDSLLSHTVPSYLN